MMLTPRILFMDTVRLNQVGMYKDAARWLGFGLFNWLIYLSLLVVAVPLVLIHSTVETLYNLMRDSRALRFHNRLQDKEDAWREVLRTEYKKRGEETL